MSKNMNELVVYLIICGYVLPLLILLAWLAWRIRYDSKYGEIHVPHFLRDCWTLLVPGVSLCFAVILLLLSLVEASEWLVGHCGLWRMAGERQARISRWITTKLLKD